MNKRYDEIMDKVEVTDEMRKRILDNLQNLSLENKPQPRILRFSSVKKYISLAACLVILFVSPFVLPKIFNNDPSDEVMGLDYWDVSEVSSLTQLEEKLGFEMQEINDLPFTPEKKTYIAYGSSMAEILYESGEQTARFRKSKEQEDNSGDYNIYAENKEISIRTVTVTLKGNSDLFTLAIWSDGDFSYSINLSDGLTADQWEALIMGIE